MELSFFFLRCNFSSAEIDLFFSAKDADGDGIISAKVSTAYMKKKDTKGKSIYIQYFKNIFIAGL